MHHFPLSSHHYQFPISIQPFSKFIMTKKTKYTAISLLFTLAFIERVFFDLGPNIELITLALLLASAYFGRKQAFWLTLILLITTDLIIGNTYIFIFTWSGFLIPAIILPKLFQIFKSTSLKKILAGSFLGAGTNFFFFVWTNFGVWFLDSWGMYPKTLPGLVTCYINALPFYKNQLVSTTVFALIGFSIFELAIAIRELREKNYATR